MAMSCRSRRRKSERIAALAASWLKPAASRRRKMGRGRAMNSRTLRILLQTTTPAKRDDWSIDSLSLLRRELEALRVEGQPVIVTARNREVSGSGSDPVLAGIDRSDFNELWLFGLDVDAGLTAEESAAIGRFRRRGGGLVTVRDHQDMGA